MNKSKSILRKVCTALFLDFFVFMGTPVRGGEAALSTHCVYFRRDPQHGKGPAGAIHIYLENLGNQPLRVTEIKLNGKSVGVLVNEEMVEEPLKFREKYLEVRNREVMWYRIWPNPIPSKGVSQVILRLATLPKEPPVVGFVCDEPGRKGSALSVKVEFHIYFRL